MQNYALSQEIFVWHLSFVDCLHIYLKDTCKVIYEVKVVFEVKYNVYNLIEIELIFQVL